MYEEGNLIKRSIRDLYTKDIDEVVVAGEQSYREAKDFMRMLMPSHAKNVVKHESETSLFAKHSIEQRLADLFSPNVTLPSGGYLVINQTEALVAIDINSGRATREFSIEDTAHKTNLEAAAEIARQLKLRDLAGLIVIDFIDMDEKRNNRSVERRLKECLKQDRARIQVGRISSFGLLEMSRQRLRTGVLEGSTTRCPHCEGTGIVRSTASIALAVLRGIEAAAPKSSSKLTAHTAPLVALYILNEKRQSIVELEETYGIRVEVLGSDSEQGASFTIEHAQAPRGNGAQRRPQRAAVSVDHGFETATTADNDEEDNGDGVDERRPRRRRRRRGGRRGDAGELTNGHDRDDDDALAASDEIEAEPSPEADDDEAATRERRPRRRGRRGGQRSREARSTQVAGFDPSDPDAPQPELESEEPSPYVEQAATVAAAASAARRRTGRNRGGRGRGQRQETMDQDVVLNEAEAAVVSDDPTEMRVSDEAAPVDEIPAQQPESAAIASSVDEPESPGDPNTNGAHLVNEDAGLDQVAPVLEADANTEAGNEPAAEMPMPRGEPTSSTPILKRLIVGVADEREAETGGDAKPQKRGWWQRNFG